MCDFWPNILPSPSFQQLCICIEMILELRFKFDHYLRILYIILMLHQIFELERDEDVDFISFNQNQGKEIFSKDIVHSEFSALAFLEIHLPTRETFPHFFKRCFFKLCKAKVAEVSLSKWYECLHDFGSVDFQKFELLFSCF